MTPVVAPATMGSVTDPHDDRATEPWDRFAWLMGVVWVFFLYFPLQATFSAGLDQKATAASALSQILFGIVYIVGFIAVSRARDAEAAWRRAWPVLVVLALLTVFPLMFVGVEALGVVPFAMAMAMFSTTLRRSLALAGAMFALLVVAVVASGRIGDLWILFVPGVIVMTMTGLVRWVSERQEAHEAVARQLDLVAERERVARDVHDALGHSLTVVTVKAELAERLIERDPEAARREIAQIRSLSREALAEVRATVAGLRVTRLVDEIEAARVALAGAGVACEIRGAADDVDPRRRIIVAWTLREAVTNVVRHARATRCAIALEHDGLVVEDDGVGISPSDAASGLRGVRERAEAAGATVSVGPRAGARGTRVEVRW